MNLHKKSFAKQNVKEQKLDRKAKWEDEIEHPVFCFRHLHKDYHIDKCETVDKVRFLERIVKLCNLTWQEIKLADKHGFGTEKIPKKNIKQQLPKEVTEDVPLLALRYNGKKPFVGFKNRFVFHVLFIDRNLTLYKH